MRRRRGGRDDCASSSACFIPICSTKATDSSQMATDEELQKQLDRALSAALSSDQTSWVIFSIFWAANAVFFDALHDGWEHPHSGYAATICLAGTLGSAVWWAIQARVLAHQRWREDVVAILETRLGYGYNEYSKAIRLSTKENPCSDKQLQTTLGARPLMIGSSALLAHLWIFLFGCFVGRDLWLRERLTCSPTAGRTVITLLVILPIFSWVCFCWKSSRRSYPEPNYIWAVSLLLGVASLTCALVLGVGL